MTILSHLGACKIREVWAWNFESEFAKLCSLVARCRGSSTTIAVDTEFPGCIHDVPRRACRATQHRILCGSVDVLRPIQLGIAVAVDGVHSGVWNFNLKFDLATDLHTEEAVTFLSVNGIDFARHATQGVDARALGVKLAASPAFATTSLVTFSGQFDLAYLVKLLTGQNLPRDLQHFDAVLTHYFPQRYDLRDYLPRGSLQVLLDQYGVQRSGAAHNAGSDALATLELFARVVPLVQDSNSSPAASVKKVVETDDVQGQQRAWLTAARAAMRGTTSRTSADVEEAAPPTLWAASARQAMEATTKRASRLSLPPGLDAPWHSAVSAS